MQTCPSLHHCKEGWRTEGRARQGEASIEGRRGGFPYGLPRDGPFGKPPRPRFQRRLRGILLIARPPLLAVMQGGEYLHVLTYRVE